MGKTFREGTVGLRRMLGPCALVSWTMLGAEGKYTWGEMRDTSVEQDGELLAPCLHPYHALFPACPAQSPCTRLAPHAALPQSLAPIWSEPGSFSSSLLPSPSSFWTQHEWVRPSVSWSPLVKMSPRQQNGLGWHSDERDS